MTSASAAVDPQPGDVPALYSEPAQPPRVRLGIETISDVVFGLSLGIGSIALVSKVPQTTSDLTRDIVEFGFTFVIIFMVWFAYRRATVVFPHETQLTLIVNVALLFCVSIEPFLFYVTVATTATSVGGSVATALALDVGTMMLLLAAFYFLLLAEDRKHPRRRVHPEILRQLRVASVGRIVVGIIFLVSALAVFDTPGLFGATIRENIWIVALGLFLAAQFGTSSRPRGHATGGSKPS